VGGDGGALGSALVSFLRLARFEVDEDVEEATAAAGAAATRGAMVVTGGVDASAGLMTGTVITAVDAATAARSSFLAAFLSARLKGAAGWVAGGSMATDADTGALLERCVFLEDEALNAATAAACEEVLVGV
jgi:hypothetical protein